MKPSSELHIPLETDAGPGKDQESAGVIPALVYRAQAANATLILAPGAGAGQRSAFMTAFAAGIASLGIDVVTFDFPYITAKRKIPDRGPALEAAYRAVIAGIRMEIDSARRFLFIGGKSMGGRIATQVAAADAALPATGLVLLGYPLHPPGRPETLRAAHLPAIARPMLFVQGSRDAFGTPAELDPILAPLVPPPVIQVVAGGDHSLNVSRRDPQKQAKVYDDVQHAIVRWIKSVIEKSVIEP